MQHRLANPNGIVELPKIDEHTSNVGPQTLMNLHQRERDLRCTWSIVSSWFVDVHCPSWPSWLYWQFPTFGSLIIYTMIIQWSWILSNSWNALPTDIQQPKAKTHLEAADPNGLSALSGMRKWHPKVSNHHHPHHPHHPSLPLPSNLCWTEWRCALLALHQTLSASSRSVGPESLPHKIGFVSVKFSE